MGVADLNQRWLIIAALVLINAAFAYVAWVPVCPRYSIVSKPPVKSWEERHR